MSKLLRALGQGATLLVRQTKTKAATVKVAKQPVDLDLISTATHHGCMRLPQELVDYIVSMLREDLRALKTCSLTCKAMFASTRHLIHQKLCVTARNNNSILTPAEKFRYQRWGLPDLELRFISYMGERDLLRYTRQVHICMPCYFTPETLQPHLHYFQSLNRVHTLVIESYPATKFANIHRTCFAHFYGTLTSLVIRRAFGHYRLLLQFALQFPNLDNLCLERLVCADWNPPELTPFPNVDQPPPLRGHLRLADYSPVAHWPVSFFHEPPKWINFQSVELEDPCAACAQHILDACAHTLQSLTIVPRGIESVGYLDLGRIGDLRWLTLRTVFSQLMDLGLRLIHSVLSTIHSPIFSELVLEMCGLPSHFSRSSLEHWGDWGEVDRFLEDQFATRGDFRLIVKTGRVYDSETFQRHAKEAFPLLANRERIHFEIFHSIDKYLR